MKKILISLLVVILAVSAAIIPGECVSVEKSIPNASSVELLGDKIAINAKQGDTVEIVTSVNNAKLVNGLLVKMFYDSNLLAYDGTDTTKLGRTIINTDETNRVLWSIMFSAKGTDFDNSTEVNVLKFKVLSNIYSDNECFSYSIEEFYNTSYTELSRSSINVFCRVIQNSENDLLGDANGDGKVSNADALAIVRHSIKAAKIPEDRQHCCDVNGDGKITNADALQITRYTIGYTSKYSIGQRN